MAVFCFILGAILFLAMVHPVVFWCAFVPFVVISAIMFIRWLKK